MTFDESWKDDFFNLYFNLDPSKRDEGFALLLSKRPKIFCKYMNPSRAIQFMNSSRLWHSSMNKFVDKFDGKWYCFNTDCCQSKEDMEIIEYFQKVVLDDSNNIYRESLRVCSLTTDPLNKKMWDEYGAESRGVCFEFATDTLNQILNEEIKQLQHHLYPMLYSTNKINLSDLILSGDNPGWNNSQFPLNFLRYYGYCISILKDRYYWEENEWRSIWYNPTYEGPFDHVSIPINVYLGTRIRPRIKRRIMKRFPESKIFQLRLIHGALIPQLIRDKL